MNLCSDKIVLVLLVAAFASAAHLEAADPVGDFFKRLGNSISNAGKRPATHRSSDRSRRSGGKNANAAQQQQQGDASPNATISAGSPTPAVPVRAAAAASDSKGKRRDLPYGIPVAGKPGFVTSPFAPNAGVVDVREFPSGTEVVDPYTGRMFLTP